MKRISAYIFFVMIASFMTFSALAKDAEYPGSDSGVYMESLWTGVDPLQKLISTYSEWENAQFSGKLVSDKLPVSPGIKIYMQRDSLLQLSVRVPLMGEVGRLELTKERLLLINKMNKVYCEEDTEHLNEIDPFFIEEIQSLLLGRVVVPGQGVLNSRNAGAFKVDEMENGGFLLYPDGVSSVIPYDFGYMIGGNSRILAILLSVDKKMSVEMRYGYKNRGEQIEVMFDFKNMKVSAGLNFESVKWGGTPMSPLKTGGYEKVSLKKFFSHLKK